MKAKIFDVVELKDGNRATILKDNKSIYKVEIVNPSGITKGITQIEEKDINKIIFQNNK